MIPLSGSKEISDQQHLRQWHLSLSLLSGKKCTKFYGPKADSELLKTICQGDECICSQGNYYKLRLL